MTWRWKKCNRGIQNFNKRESDYQKILTQIQLTRLRVRSLVAFYQDLFQVRTVCQRNTRQDARHSSKIRFLREVDLARFLAKDKLFKNNSQEWNKLLETPRNLLVVTRHRKHREVQLLKRHLKSKRNKHQSDHQITAIHLLRVKMYTCQLPMS